MCNQNCAVLVPIPTFLEPYVYFSPEHPEFGIDEQGRRCLAIDACMVDALRALWDREIPTISACCLHGAGEGGITLPRVVEPGTELPKPNWLQRDEALDRLTASEQEAARLREVWDWAEALVAWTTNVLDIAASRRIPSADVIADGEAILAGVREALGPVKEDQADATE